MKNRIQTLPSAALLNLAARMLYGIETSPDGLGLPSGLVDALAQSRTEAAEASVAVGVARDRYRASVVDREAKDAACAALAATIARMLYANPGVDAAAIASTGLQPRPTTRSRVVPQTPTQVSLTKLPNGEVVLRWTKNNRYGVIYQVECLTGSEAWTFVASTTAGKIELRGYPEGVQVQFRVRAARCGQVSPPSPVAVAWLGSPARVLRAAA